MRVGWGFDVHRLVDDGRVLLAGVVVDAARGVAATSDGDVVAHAVADAMLGVSAKGDLGERYPSDAAESQDADSMLMLEEVAADCRAAGLEPLFVDVTVIAQTMLVAPYRGEIRTRIAAVLGVAIDAVSVKATTTDGLGFLGRDEGIAAAVVVTARMS